MTEIKGRWFLYFIIIGTLLFIFREPITIAVNWYINFITRIFTFKWYQIIILLIIDFLAKTLIACGILGIYDGTYPELKNKDKYWNITLTIVLFPYSLLNFLPFLVKFFDKHLTVKL